MILGIDTTSGLTSVALVSDGSVLAASAVEGARRHAEALAPELSILVRRSGDEVVALACGVGPGPYTGLRVGITSALALGLAWGVPVYGLCSLDAIAAAAVGGAGGAEVSGVIAGGFCVAIDARRNEIYWARYDGTGARVDGPRVNRPADLSDDVRHGPWVGRGAVAYAESLGTVVECAEPAVAFPHAAWVALSVERLVAAGAVVADVDPALAGRDDDGSPSADALEGHLLLPPRPLYLRRPDAVPAGTAL